LMQHSDALSRQVHIGDQHACGGVAPLCANQNHYKMHTVDYSSF
jgi:hypothetical protein